MPFTMTRRLRRAAVGALCAAAVALPLQFAGAALATTGLAATGPATATTTAPSTTLKLQNGWTASPWGNVRPSVRMISGIVTFRGAIATSSSNTNPVAFTLPKAFRPVASVWVPVTLCSAHNGRLYIQPDGVVTVQVENNVLAAQCMTSLDGASFAKSGTSFTALKTLKGWTNGAYGSAKAGARTINGIVHLRGGVLAPGGITTSSSILMLPKAFWPAKFVDVKTNLCNSQTGSLVIFPDGLVEVQAENDYSEATCFTSLDGVWYPKSGSSFSALKLQNGWANGISKYAKAAVRNMAGVVRLRGLIDTNGSSSTAFTLPKADRPAGTVYVPVDLTNATSGQLIIHHNGVVSVLAENGDFNNAAAWTSLDGVSFVR
jgi:hypothetical protein